MIKKNLTDDYTVGIDTANGATYKIAEEVFTKLGIKYKIISNTPNGVNINKDCGSTHMENLQRLVKDSNLSLGIAYDGDGDRCLAVDEDGEVIAIDIFHDDLDGLAYMEIEFASIEESDAYGNPDWVIKDVTSDINYKNGYLARYGIPK